MTDDELAELIQDCPTLYHMAERGSWPSIRDHGLLSTSALLDLYGVTGNERDAIEGQRRPQGVVLQHPTLQPALVRDQKPLSDAGLAACLLDGLSPQDWYRLLNSRVYFWLTKDRLIRLLEARPYKALAHDVLEVDTASLIEAHRPGIALSPINSGALGPFPTTATKRGRRTFLPIDDYPYADWRKRGRKPGERVVELTVDDGVPDIRRFVRRVTRMQGSAELGLIEAVTSAGGPAPAPPGDIR